MSHFKERKHKNCLNCNAVVYDKYCGVCGQENIEPQETTFHLLRHFFEDITHFDGKFFTSVKYLLTKLGFLTREYVAGRRMSYLNPIRFYVFTSFLFFLIVFAFIGDVGKNMDEGASNSANEKEDTTDYVSKNKYTIEDSIDLKTETAKGLLGEIKKNIETSKNTSTGLFSPVLYRDRKQFDSLDKLKQVDISFLRRLYINKKFEQKEKYGGNKELMAKTVVENLIHLIPQALLFTLPFFALVLQLLYLRRKQFYYVGHIIFTIHFYIFVYIQILLINFVSQIAGYFHNGLLYDLTLLLGLGIPFYMYKAMRNFYEQSRLKTFFKLCILSFFLLFIFLFFILFLVGFSFYKT